MRPRPLVVGLGLALAAGAGSVRVSCAPDSAARKDAAAQPRGAATTAGPFRLVIERIVQNSSLTLDFAGEHAEEGGQSVYLYLAAIAPDRDKASGITGLASGATATTDTGQTIRLSGYSRNEEEAPDGHSWKAYLLARDLDLAARRLREVRGDLVVYPHAQSVRIELPLDQALPLTKTVDGLRVTASELKWENREATVTVTEEWSPGTVVARTRTEAPFGITAVSAAGASTYASEGRSTVSGSAGEARQAFRLVFSQLAEKPARLVFEALVRSGAPMRVPFCFADLALPGSELRHPKLTVTLPPVPAAPALRAASGGAALDLSVEIAGRPAGEGTLTLGLRAAGAGAAWRWLSASTDRSGRARIDNLKPGRYDVRLRWSPRASMETGELTAGRWRGDCAELAAAPGRTTTLPPLEWVPDKQ